MTIDEYTEKAIATLIGTHEYGDIDGAADGAGAWAGR